MRLLISGGASDLALALAHALGREHDVRLTDRVQVPAARLPDGVDFAVSDLGSDASTRLLCQDRDLLLLTPIHPLETDTNQDVIDTATRRVYNLLVGAVEARLTRVIALSILALMDAYDSNFTVSERWRPRPTTEPRLLAAYLTECVCREFAREHKLHVTLLRIGDVAGDDDTLPAGGSGLRMSDLAQAIEKSAAHAPRPWAVYHIQSEVENSRYSTRQAKESIGYLAG